MRLLDKDYTRESSVVTCRRFWILEEVEMKWKLIGLGVEYCEEEGLYKNGLRGYFSWNYWLETRVYMHVTLVSTVPMHRYSVNKLGSRWHVGQTVSVVGCIDNYCVCLRNTLQKFYLPWLIWCLTCYAYVILLISSFRYYNGIRILN